jgi:hypothetical protein
MQPFNHSQQQAFRYFDSDMAKKRPLVVSFRRIQKMTPNNLESCGSVSICDIHRVDSKTRESELMTMKIMSKYGANFSRSTAGKKNLCHENHSYRNISSMDKQRPQLDSLFHENIFSPTPAEKGCVFPKEKFYGNAKLLLTVNDDILRKALNDQHEDPYDRYIDMKRNSNRNIYSMSHFIKDDTRCNYRPKLKSYQHPTITSLTAGNEMINEDMRTSKAAEVKNHFLWNEDDIKQSMGGNLITENDKPQSEKILENGTTPKALQTIPKSSSADTPLKKLPAFKEHLENDETFGNIQKSVSMLSFIDVG